MSGILGLVLVLSLVGTKDTDLDDFVEKDIRVFFSSFPTFTLGLDEGSGVLVAHSKYINPSKHRFITKARLVKSGNKHVMIFGEDNVCKDGNSVIKCKDERPWELDRKPFGYTISMDGKCITKGPDATIELKTCVNTDDQVVDFKPADLGGCGGLESLLGVGDNMKAGTTNVNILPPGHYSSIGIVTGGHEKDCTTEESEHKVPQERNIVIQDLGEDSSDIPSSSEGFAPIETALLRSPYTSTRGHRRLGHSRRHRHPGHKHHHRKTRHPPG